jgi:capsular polysaccharide biosynthesis protein
MPISQFFGVLRRRWLLVLVGVLLTMGVSGTAYVLVKPTYEVTGTLLFLPPQSSLASGTVNPYLQLDGLLQTVNLVGVSLSDQQTQLELEGMSKDVQFTVQADGRTNSPVLVIDVKDSSPTSAIKIRDLLIARAPVRLSTMQEALAVRPNDRVTATVLTLDSQAQEIGKNRLRAGVIVGCLGLVLTLVAATLWDSHRRRSAGRRIAPDPFQEATLPVEGEVEEAGAAEPSVPLRAVSAGSAPEFDMFDEFADASDDTR